MSLLLCATLMAPSLADKPEELIVGTWLLKKTQGDVTVEVTITFEKDGTVKGEVKVTGLKDPLPITGKYKLLDEKTIETETTTKGETTRDKGTFTVTKEKLSIVNEKGMTTEFQRASK
jgi:hypothetical protein